MNIALGIDTSLTATGLVAIPFDWGLDWSRVRRLTVGKKLPDRATVAQQVERLRMINAALYEFGTETQATHAWMEEYAFSSKASRAHSLGEIGGQLKCTVVEQLGLPLATVPPASARKLLGTMPRKGAKDEAHIRLTRAGAPTSWTRDELDAFLAANYGLSGIKGADALILEV